MTIRDSSFFTEGKTLLNKEIFIKILVVALQSIPWTKTSKKGQKMNEATLSNEPNP